ncbi:MAG TPA: histidine phosphatase family protein [Candidatus Limnocylindrales bacterium]|nr:histidine phosphatase family protein [Candidatus Limnocylindrales bacterium]
MTAEPAAPTRLVLARHGETEWSKSGQHTGRTDIPLTDVGRDQARRLGDALAGRTFARVVSSPLVRALETCRIAGFGDRVEIDEELQEWDYGAYEGRRRVDIALEEPGWTVWSRPIRDGESLVELGDRADRVIAGLLHTPGDVLVFSHGHFLRVLAARWIEAPPLLASRLELATATISELGWETDRRVVEAWNAAGHLAG